MKNINEEYLTIIYHPNADGSMWECSVMSDRSDYTFTQGNTKGMLYAAADNLDKDNIKSIIIDDGTGSFFKIK